MKSFQGANKDSQVRKILGLKSPEFSVSVHAHQAESLDGLAGDAPAAASGREKADGRGEVRQVSYPLGERPGHHLRLRDADRPGAGSRCRRPCSLRHSLARVVAQRQQQPQRQGIEDTQDPPQTATIDIASSVPAPRNCSRI